MAEPINMLLLVEDDDNDIIITRRKISRSAIQINQLLITRTLEETKDALKTHQVDVILLDLNLPDSQGLDTLDAVRTVYEGIVIVLTSIDDELVGIESIRRGADEYLVKNQLHEQLLGKAIYYAIERKKRWARIGEAHEKLDKLSDMVNVNKGS